jgi:APA family basic amino acid/polyamine antiporter
LISVFYSYGGYQCALNFGGDFRSAGRTMPRAILAGIAVVVAIYLLINLAYYRVLGMEGIAGASLVAAEIARALAGESASAIVSAVIVLSAMGFLNVTLMQIPRTYVAMAEQHALPEIFARVHPRTQVQTFGLAFFGAMIFLAIAFLGTFEKLLNYVMLFDTLNNALVASTVFVLRRRKVTAPGVEPYRVPGYPVLPAVFVMFLVVISLNVVLSQGMETLIGLALLLAGYPVYRLLRVAVART